MSRDLGRDVPDLEKLYTRKYWADFSYPISDPISRVFAIVSLRYPPSRDTFSAIPAIPKQGAIPPLVPCLHRHISAMPHIATYRAIIMILMR